jgi:hypothetical protein
MAVRLQTKAPPRLPVPAFYEPPAPLRPASKLPLIVVNGRQAGAPARIRAALHAFSTGAFRDTFNRKPAR